MRVILADDQKDIRSGLKILLENEPDLEIVGEASDLDGLIVRIKEYDPDLILLDWELSNLRLSNIIPLLRLLRPALKIIALSGLPEASKTAITAGVDAFVSKGEHPEKLLEAIRTINI